MLGALPEILFLLTGELVHRHIDQDRARTAGLSKTERLVHDLRKSLDIIDSPDSLADRLKELVLSGITVHVDFLMRMLAVVVARDIACDDDHGDGVEGSVCDTGKDVGDARPKVAHHDGRLVGDTRITVSCGGSNSLVTVGNVLQGFRAGHCVQHSDDSVTAKAEDVFYAAALKVIHHQISDKFLCHGFSSLKKKLTVDLYSRHTAGL